VIRVIIVKGKEDAIVTEPADILVGAIVLVSPLTADGGVEIIVDWRPAGVPTMTVLGDILDGKPLLVESSSPEDDSDVSIRGEGSPTMAGPEEGPNGMVVLA